MAEEIKNKPDAEEILRVEHLKKYFPIEKNLFGKTTAYLRAVDDVSFTVKRGTTIGIVGESGCGKTTLGRTILRLYDVDGGKIYFKGNDITNLSRGQMQKYRTQIQLVFQDPYSSLPPRMTVGNIIAEAVKVHHIVPAAEVYEYVLDIMQKCGLRPQFYDRYPHEFSGGQRQRICIARALAVKPELIICDEPVSALDVSIQAQVLNLLKELQDKFGTAYLFIAHDLSVVQHISDRVAVMYLGKMVEVSDWKTLYSEPHHPYTQSLLSAVPVPDPDIQKTRKRIILAGDPPSPLDPPTGCRFHTRCPIAQGICSEKLPEFKEVAPGHCCACHFAEPFPIKESHIDL